MVGAAVQSSGMVGLASTVGMAGRPESMETVGLAERALPEWRGPPGRTRSSPARRAPMGSSDLPVPQAVLVVPEERWLVMVEPVVSVEPEVSVVLEELACRVPLQLALGPMAAMVATVGVVASEALAVQVGRVAQHRDLELQEAQVTVALVATAAMEAPPATAAPVPPAPRCRRTGGTVVKVAIRVQRASVVLVVRERRLDPQERSDRSRARLQATVATAAPVPSALMGQRSSLMVNRVATVATAAPVEQSATAETLALAVPAGRGSLLSAGSLAATAALAALAAMAALGDPSSVTAEPVVTVEPVATAVLEATDSRVRRTPPNRVTTVAMQARVATAAPVDQVVPAVQQQGH